MQIEDGKNIVVGVLAFQGSFAEHRKMIEGLGYKTLEVRTTTDLEKVNALIIPGGESTTMKHHLALSNLRGNLMEKIGKGFPVYGTCAGAILLAKNVDAKPNSDGIPVMDIEISRNAYGSQLDSFEEILSVKINGRSKEIPALYIRAPKINSVSDEVKILIRNNKKEIVMAKQGNILVTTFHPELTDDKTVHQYFIEEIIRTP